MRIRLLAIIILSLYGVQANGQKAQWTDQIFSNAFGSVYEMKPDNSGNLLVAAFIDDAGDFCGFKYSYALPSGQPGASLCISKLDTSGQMLWTQTFSKSIGGPSQYGSGLVNDYMHLEIGNQNDYFFSGYLQPGYTFGGYPGQKLPKEHSFSFIAKCDTGGQIKWIRKYIDYTYQIAGNPNFNKSVGVFNNFKVDEAENVYFSGFLNDSAHGNHMTIQGKDYYVHEGQSFVASFDSTGQLNWLFFDSLNLNWPTLYPNFIEKDGKGNIYSLFEVQDGRGRFLYNMITKLDKNGHLVMRKPIYTPTTLIGPDIQIGKHDEVYISKDSSYNGLGNACITRLDQNLNPVWTILDHGYLSGSGSNNRFFNINPQTGFLYLTGEFKRNMDWGGIKIQTAPDDTGYNAFIAKIDSTGKVYWILHSTGADIPYLNTVKYIILNSLSVEDACNNLFVLMMAQQKIQFGSISIDNSNDKKKTYTGFLAKFSSDTIGFINQNNACGLSLKNISKPVYKKFHWYAAKIPGDTTLGQLIATTRDLNYQPPHSGHYVISLQGDKAGGCTNIYRDTFNIAGSPVAGFMAGDSQGCQYVNFSFSDTSHADSINKAVGESWQWDFGDSANSGVFHPQLSYSKTKRPTVSHVYTQSGIYTVKLVCGNGICTDTFVSAQKVTIVPAPKPGFAVNAMQGCAPLAVQVTDKSVGGVIKRAYTVRSLANNGPKDSVFTPSFGKTFPDPGRYMIHQYLTGTTGCITEDSVLVRVHPGVAQPNMLRASFDILNRVTIQWQKTPGAAGYNLYKSMGTAVPPKASARIAQLTDTTFTDPEGGAILTPFPNVEGLGGEVYTLQVTDSCQGLSPLSLAARPVVLSGQNMDNQYFLLHWTPYQQWAGGVLHYDIELKNKEGIFAPIYTLTDTGYHDADHFVNTDINQCYRIVATELGGNNQVSYSNTLCLPYKPMLFIPNAFSPDGNGHNDTFKVVTIGFKSYVLNIYNRWGELIYTSTPSAPSTSSGTTGSGSLSLPKGGWDGRFHGATVPEGVYLYTIAAYGDVQDVFQHGTVEVVK